MRMTVMVAMMAIGMSARAGEAGESSRQRVIVYINMDSVESCWLLRAEVIAAGMFSRAGVQIEWRGHKPNGGQLPAGAISVSLAPLAPGGFVPGALAFAVPYEGVHITVFWDRLQRLTGSHVTPTLLAHVLVHEITHILQGIDRHSDSGVMKARWTLKDYADMTWKPLPLAPEDIELIHLGLA